MFDLSLKNYIYYFCFSNKNLKYKDLRTRGPTVNNPGVAMASKTSPRSWRLAGEDGAWRQLTGAAAVPLQFCLQRYQQCSILLTRTVRIVWGLTVATVLILYKLLVISYRLTVGMTGQEEELTVPDLIRSHQYQVETHTVQTDDGYCLQLHRIPGRGKPVLLIHGMMCSSYCWVTSDSNSLAFILADAGYDVWLGNFRGTKYSRAHSELDPDKHLAFWRFSLHELGVKDLAAMISNIVRISGRSKISFIGHSMGTTCFLILASYRPRLAQNIDLAILMAPVVRMED